MKPLTEALVRRWLRWLPGQAYPVRYGTEHGSAFALSLAWPFAEARASAGDPALLDAIATRAAAWFSADLIYPADWEPSGEDYLSPALTEAELMGRVLPGDEFAGWLTMFLPGIEWGRPASLFTPVAGSDADSSDKDSSDPAADPARPGDLLDGLNASRAWCWRRIASCLPPGDPRIEPALGAARQHAKAALPYVLGTGYQAEHWLASYAVLMLS